MKSSILYSAFVLTILTSACSKKEAEPTKVTPPPTAPKVQTEVQKPKPATIAPLEKEQKTIQSTLIEQTKNSSTNLQEKIKTETASLTSAISVEQEAVLADLNLSVDEIKQQVAGFDLAKTTAYASKYKEVLSTYKDKIAGLSDRIKGLSMGDMLGGKGAGLKDELTKYTETFSSLKDRYGVYLSKLKDYGVDLSAYGL